MPKGTLVCALVAAALVAVAATPGSAAEPPPVKLALSFRPTQSDIDYDIPDAKIMEGCKVNVLREGKASGWNVIGPQGQTLRRYMDTNGDNIVDQWSYFRNGIEVYRDIDSNFNNKVDQCRWLNTGGSRWGSDTNEDGRIDAWRIISAEEVSRVVIRALISQDANLLAPLLITAQDLKSLGIKAPLDAKILDSVANPSEKLRKAIAGSKMIHAKTNWMRFDGSAPGIIPADQLNTPGDIMVYENVMAIVETGANPGLVQIGELVRIGDVWKLTGFPQPLEGEGVQITEGGLLMQPIIAADTPDNPVAAANGIPPAMQKLLEDLQELDKRAPPPVASRVVVAKYNADRADLLTRLRDAAPTEEGKIQWTHQLADGIAAAVQVGAYPNGLDRLRQLEVEMRKNSPKVAPYITYRRMLAEYSVDVQNADNEARQKVQERWLKDLEAFVTDNPKASDTPDALLHLAIALELSGQVDKSRTWYTRLTSGYKDTPAAVRASGALQRLELVGRPLVLSGSGLEGGTLDVKQYRGNGKLLLVVFWATWCKPCTEDLPQIKALYDEYHGRGFEILGVNLDTSKELIGPYLAQYGVRWQHIYEPGGLESEPSRAFGIISLPTMMIVDGDGKVITRSASVSDLKNALTDAYKAK